MSESPPLYNSRLTKIYIQYLRKYYPDIDLDSILKDAGYTWGADTMLVSPDGVKLRSLKVTCPKGWTDWESTVDIFVEGLRAIGVDAKQEFLEWGDFWQNLINGQV